MAAILQRTVSHAFSSMKLHEFWLKFHWNLFLRVQLQYFSIGLANGLAPTRQQAIISTNDGSITDAYIYYLASIS